MANYVPEALLVLGSLIGGMSLFLQERRVQEIPVAEETPRESSIGRDCGAISLYLICRASGISSSLEEIRKLTKTSVTGTSMYDIKEAAEQQGFQSRGTKCSFEALWDYLSGRGHYAILYFRSGHFDPAVQIADGKIRIVDTRRLETKDCSAEELNKMGWDETALLLQR